VPHSRKGGGCTLRQQTYGRSSSGGDSSLVDIDPAAKAEEGRPDLPGSKKI
jgi:hypothetical protein